ncbi:hypothetical protein C2G38_2103067, partial [Gigaspora rosea]
MHQTSEFVQTFPNSLITKLILPSHNSTLIVKSSRVKFTMFHIPFDSVPITASNIHHSFFNTDIRRFQITSFSFDSTLILSLSPIFNGSSISYCSFHRSLHNLTGDNIQCPDLIRASLSKISSAGLRHPSLDNLSRFPFQLLSCVHDLFHWPHRS